MLKIYSLENHEEWDKIVKSFNNYDVYYLSGYVKAFKLHGDGEPMLFYYQNEELRGINVVMKRDVSKCNYFEETLPENTYFDFSTPYGYGGWLIEGDITKKQMLFSEYENWCANNNIICEFVRFHPVLDNARFSKDNYEVIDLGKTVCLDISDNDVIWANITSKNRNVIRKAEKSGVEIHISDSAEIYKKFTEIYNGTMEHDNAEEYYFFGKEFYDSIRQDLCENAKVFYAELEGKIIAASIMLVASDKLNYHLSGSLFEYRNFAPSNLLLYKAALWGCENGCKTMHLGGGVGSGEDNLFKFKKSFYRKDDLKQFSIGKKIFIEEEYNRFVELRKEIQSNFFPKYRAKE